MNASLSSTHEKTTRNAADLTALLEANRKRGDEFQAEMAEREKRMDELQEAVDAFPTVLDKKVASAAERSPGWFTHERQGRVSREDREKE